MRANRSKVVLQDQAAPDAAMIQEMRGKITKQCADEVNAVLLKHRCALVGVPLFVQDGQGGWKLKVKIDTITVD